MEGKQLILILLGVVAIGFLVWFFRKLKANQDEIKETIEKRFAGKHILKWDRLALHVAQESSGLSQSRGNGNLILTQDELFFAMPMPRKILSIPINHIGEIERVTRMCGKSIGRPLLKVNFKTTEGKMDAIAFHVKELDAWEQALQK